MNATKYLFAAACAAIACQAAQAETQAFRVNGQLVTKAQQDQILAELTRNGQAVTPQVEQQVKMTLVRDAVLLDAAAKQKLESRKEVRDAIESTRRQILIRAAIGEWVQKNPVPAADVLAG
ncbi:MAG: peptidylprolyl isomerase, partial [Duodenibacillus sp.]|nr:peptidylprolyl isomerase [Duodenibacillus sp.]